MRLATALAIVALAAALLTGCGGSSSSTANGSTQTGTGAPPKASTPGAPVGASARNCETRAANAEGLRVVGVSCGKARKVMYGWQLQGSCASPTGVSRTSCSVRSYRCLSGSTDRGAVVGCSRPGESIAFIDRSR